VRSDAADARAGTATTSTTASRRRIDTSDGSIVTARGGGLLDWVLVDRLRVVGGRPLEGSVRISGAKNASLPDLCAALLTDQSVRLRNVPQVRDIRTLARLLSGLGVDVRFEVGGAIELRASRIESVEAPYELVKTMRASVLVLGPLLARAGRARVSLPGGCAIGARPINLHLLAFEKMGARIRVESGYVEAEAGEPPRAESYFAPRT